MFCDAFLYDSWMSTWQVDYIDYDISHCAIIHSASFASVNYQLGKLSTKISNLCNNHYNILKILARNTASIFPHVKILQLWNYSILLILTSHACKSEILYNMAALLGKSLTLTYYFGDFKEINLNSWTWAGKVGSSILYPYYCTAPNIAYMQTWIG